MAVSKVILNGTTLIDTTDKTVTAGSMLNGVTALKNDGTTATGSIASKSSADLTASSATVTAPAGYYSTAASKSVATTTHPKPTASINSTTGVVTASHTQTAGYVAAGTTTGMLELSTQAAKTVAPTESEQTAVAAGKYTTGTVKVGAISSTYVGSNIDQNDSADLTVDGATVTAPAGYYAESASKSVASGTAGTPTASKGTVSNHSISVTPSVTNSTGYITGGTKNGTAVTVSASELVSGTKSISAAGETDVTNYEKASVSAGSATTPAISITANPTISVSASGLITATTSASKSVTPTVSAGYVSSGTAGTVSVSGSNTQQLSTQAAATITPSTTSQTAVAAGKYTTGSVTIDPIPSQYIVPSGTKEITENGTGIDVSSYATVDVAVPGQEATGIKYIWTDFDGEGAWDVSGYARCAVDGAPIGDDAFVLWLNIPQDNYEAKVYFYYASSTEETIDWGDGTVETSTKSRGVTNTHVYSQAGRYGVVVKNGGIVSNYCVGQTTSDPNDTLVFAEIPGASGANNKSAVFTHCSALKKIYFHDGITALGMNYAINCTSLESVRLPSTLTSIGSAFKDCTSLSKVSLPYGLVTIGENAFNNCSSLKYLEIPSTVTSIGANALSYTALDGIEKSTYVFLPATPPTIQSSTFNTGLFTNVEKIYVPAASLDAYKTATNWSTLASYMEAIPE